MIVVDTSAWVELLRATGSRVDRTLTGMLERRAPLAITEVVVMELLAGVRSQRERRALRAQLLAMPVLALQGVADFERAADLYRAARSRGVTPRQLTDVLVALCALDAGASVLHSDRDFDHLADAIGVPVEAAI